MGTEEWKTAFTQGVIGPLRRDPNAVAIYDSNDLGAFRRVSNRGQISAGEDRTAVLWEAFLYQRHHMDAVRSVLDQRFFEEDSRDFVVLDLGCGAGTVAAALGEIFERWDRNEPIYYVGWDHNRYAIGLASDICDGTGVLPDDSEFQVHNELRRALDRVVRWLDEESIGLLSSSYLFHQQLADQDLDLMADATRRLVKHATRRGSPIYFVGCDIYAGGGRLDDFLVRVQDQGVVVTQMLRESDAHEIDYVTLYPESEAWIRQSVPGNKINLERWVYRFER